MGAVHQSRYLDPEGLAYFFARLKDIFVLSDGSQTIDYNKLSGLPSINGVTIKGNLTAEDLSLSSSSINTSDGWNLKKTYVPKRGEIVIYLDRSIIDDIAYPGVKIGDGNAYVADLPFIGDDTMIALLSAIRDHVGNLDIHVTSEEKERWNNKLNYEIHGEELTFTKL